MKLLKELNDQSFQQYVTEVKEKLGFIPNDIVMDMIETAYHQHIPVDQIVDEINKSLETSSTEQNNEIPSDNDENQPEEASLNNDEV